MCGSSPLTRGKREQRLARRVLSGLIPAHAGKTVRARTPAARFRAHPRSRGENSTARRGQPPISGSSPLTRGKRLGVLPGELAVGLIPAHAGKTLVI